MTTPPLMRYGPALTRPDQALEEMQRYAFIFGAANYPAMVREWFVHEMQEHGVDVTAALGGYLSDPSSVASQKLDSELRHAAECLRIAVPFLWLEEARLTARAMTAEYQSTHDELWHADLFPEPVMYWCYSVNLQIGEFIGKAYGIDDVAPGSIEELGCIIDSRGDQIEQISICEVGDTICMPFRSIIGHKGQPVPASMKSTYALFEWLKSPIITDAVERPSRALRRRSVILPAQERIHVIQLRKTLSHANAGGEDRAWSRRWIVRGHQRNQWHPSINTHRPRWIPSYVKGPPDKPLVLPGQPVYKVAR